MRLLRSFHFISIDTRDLRKSSRFTTFINPHGTINGFILLAERGYLGRVRVPYIKMIKPITAKRILPIKNGTFSKLNQATRATTTPTKAKPIPNHLIKSLLIIRAVFYYYKPKCILFLSELPGGGQFSGG